MLTDTPAGSLAVWLGCLQVEWRALREIEVGVCDGLSYEQVKVGNRVTELVDMRRAGGRAGGRAGQRMVAREGSK